MSISTVLNYFIITWKEYLLDFYRASKVPLDHISYTFYSLSPPLPLTSYGWGVLWSVCSAMSSYKKKL